MASILIVDDSPSIRQAIQISLADTGHSVMEAVHGLDGLNKARGQRFDLIVTDLNMPEMNGLGMIKAVRQLPNYAGVPILFLSTESAPEVKQQAREAGATGWITKPFSPDQLVQVVSKVLSR